MANNDQRDYDDGQDDELTNILENGTLSVFRWEDDDISLRYAAVQSRLPFENLSTQEAGCFPDLVGNRASCSLYLFIRNKILQQWHMEPNVELPVDVAFGEMFPPFNSDRLLFKRIHGFLQRYGYINTGIFHKLRATTQLVGQRKKKVIVIGMGASGIAASRQLMQFGFEVVALEGKQTCGGRLHTYVKAMDNSESSKWCVDLGGHSIDGIKGNPFIALIKQQKCNPYVFNEDGAVYDECGKQLDARKNGLVEDAYEKIKQTCQYIMNAKTSTDPDGNPYSLEDMYQIILQLLEIRMQRRRRKFWCIFDQVLEKSKAVDEEMKQFEHAITFLIKKLEDSENAEEDPSEDKRYRDLRIKCLQRDVQDAYKKLELRHERQEGLETIIKDMKRQIPSEVYMNQKDRRLMDYHLAKLEYKFGTTLDQLSAKNYDSREENEFDGPKLGLRDGMGAFINLYVPTECTRTSSVIDKIKYFENGVQVEYVNRKGERMIESADCVLCTVPLGILKESVDDKLLVEEPVKAKGHAISFVPELPDAHKNAIRKMGFGNVNKVALVYEKPFWGNQTYFGHLSTQPSSRGENFQFYAQPQGNVLVALVSGTSANLPPVNSVIVRQVTAVLQTIFGVNIPRPLEAVITRWNLDPFAMGAFSFMAPETTESMFDIMVSGVKPLNSSGQRAGIERLFFAGEHTSKDHYGTSHGAWMSGIREAARIADIHLGCPFARVNNREEEEAECIQLESSDDNDNNEEEDDDITEIPHVPRFHGNGHNNGHANGRSSASSDSSIVITNGFSNGH